MSDTHGHHREVAVPEGDLLLHAGDVSHGDDKDVLDFLDWFIGLPHPRKVFVAGNMDYGLAQNPESLLGGLPDHVHYLENRSLVIDGLTIWGSPYVPQFVGVFNLPRGEALRAVWSKIPEQVDLLITHGPPYGILDRTSRGQRVGCQALRERLEALRPKLHVFGHVHESYGQSQEEDTLFLNVSLPKRGFRAFHEPRTVEIVA